MSVKCTSRVWELSKATGSHRLVLLAIADFANEDGVCWPGQDRLAKMAQISVSSVKRVIADLVESGELWRDRRKNRGHSGNGYIVLLGLTEEELERAMQLAIDLGCDAESLREALDPGIVDDTSQVSPTVRGGTTAMNHDPSLSVPDPSSSGLKDKPPVLENDYHKKIYFRDKAVNRLGTVRDGPWEVECESCGGTVYIPKLDKEFGCLCGNQVFTLLSKKPFEPTKVRKPESVEAYYAIVKSRGVRYGANEDYEVDIANSVTDVSRWRQVIKEYIHPDFGGNPYAVDKMLVYYNENRLPGTRKRKEREALSHVSRLKPVEQTWTQEDIDRYERGETVTVDMEAIRREVKKGGNNES